MPVIGSSFDAIAGQQAGWQNFNRGVEENNIARAAQAQQQQNQWLAQLAALQRQDEEVAMKNRAYYDALDYRLGEDRERSRRFDIDTKLSEQKLADDKNRYKWHEDIRNADTKQQMTAIENSAKFLAKDARDYAEQFKDATGELRDATQTLDKSASSIKPSSRITFTKARQFAPVDILKDDVLARQEANEANIRLASDKARYDQAVQNYQLHLSNWNDLKKRASLEQLQVGDDGTVYSKFHDKTFGSPLKAPVTESKPVDETPAEIPSWLKPIDTGFMSGAIGAPTIPGVFAGATTTTGTFAPPDSPNPATRPRRYNPATGRIE